MKKAIYSRIFRSSYIGLFVFFFVTGAVWGKFFYYSEENRNVLFHKNKLVLLAEENFLPVDILESFSFESGASVDLITYKDESELEKLIQEISFDLVAFKSSFAKNVVPQLGKLHYKKIANHDSISIDFKNLSYDSENQFTLPLFWGVDKDENNNKSILWIESIGISKKSELNKKAYKFLDYVLQEEIAAEVVRQKKVASTNKNLEKNKSVDSKWKPSYLRKLSIRELVFADRASF